MSKGDGKGRLTRRQDALGLVGFILLCLGVSGIGGWVTATSVTSWYSTLARPVFNPPDWVFAPVWTVLYLLMAIAAWRVWRSPASAVRKRGLTLFAVQLVLNLLWSVLFFGFQQIGFALIDILLLLSAIGLNTLSFWRTDRLAGWLFVPYLLWVIYATALNLALWRLN